jgi:hypothetical protein
MYKKTWISYKKKWYYATSDGQLVKSGWKKISGNWYYFSNYKAKTNCSIERNGVSGYLDGNGKFTTGGWVVVNNDSNKVKYWDPSKKAFLKNTSKVIDGKRYYFDKDGYRRNDVTSLYPSSKYNYYVEVNRSSCVMTIYSDSSKTVPVKSIRVSVGLSGTATPTGTYTLARAALWQPLMGPSWGQYGTHVEGAGQGGIYVHSVASDNRNPYNLPVGEYVKLGSPASHGCIRVCVADAKWVYYNCNGSTIRIFDSTTSSYSSLNDPLGKPALTAISLDSVSDPTDDFTNPY